jgi:hypothetical protein
MLADVKGVDTCDGSDKRNASAGGEPCEPPRSSHRAGYTIRELQRTSLNTLFASSLSNLRLACLMSVAGNGAPASGATENVAREKQAAPTVMDGLSSSKVTGENLLKPP